MVTYAASGFLLLCPNRPPIRMQRLPDSSAGVEVVETRNFKLCAASLNNCAWRRCMCLDMHNEIVPYEKARQWQISTIARRHALMESGQDHSDMLIILQHPPVYTLGTGSSEKYLGFDIENAPYNVYRAERGGEVTYHGPGQLIMYPIVNLRYHKMDLHWYLRSLEEVVIRALRSSFSIQASRLEGLTGVWVGNKKVAAIGIRVSRWITYHGLALNVTTDLTPFQHIVPCGLSDQEVGSINELLEVSDQEGRSMSELLGITHASLLHEFANVFQLALQSKAISTFDFSDERIL